MRLRTHAGFRLFWTASTVSDFGTPITTLGGLIADSLGYRPALWLCAGGVAAAGLALLASPFRTVR